MDQKVTVSIKVPSQTIKLDLNVPEMEVEDLVAAIAAQCESYENIEDYVDEDEEDYVDEEEFDKENY